MTGEPMLRVAMHQPNYLPWAGFFDKMHRADLFVIEDHLAFSKGKECWHARNRVRTPGGWRYLTIPIAKEYEGRPFNEVFFRETKFKKQHPRIIQNLYSKSRFYRKYFDDFCEIMLNKNDTLAAYNLEIIKWMAGCFGIKTEIVLSSELDFDRTKTKTEMIIEILKACGATHYLSGDGAKDYLAHELFPRNNIILEFQNFVQARYSQAFEGWVPNLSAVDVLFNTGNLNLSRTD